MTKPASNPFAGVTFSFGAKPQEGGEAGAAKKDEPFKIPAGGFKFAGSSLAGGSSGGFAGFAGGAARNGGFAGGGLGGGFKEGAGFGALGGGDKASEKVEEPPPPAKPVAHLEKQEAVATGEEGETTVFKGQGRLFEFVPDGKKWAERGKGDVRVNRVGPWSQARIVMREQAVKRLLLNCNVWPQIQLTVMDGKKGVTFAAQNHLDGEPRADAKPPPTSTFAIRMQPSLVPEFVSTVEDAAAKKKIFAPTPQEVEEAEAGRGKTAGGGEGEAAV